MSKSVAWEMGFCESYDIGFVGLEEGGFGGRKGSLRAPQTAGIFEIKS